MFVTQNTGPSPKKILVPVLDLILFFFSPDQQLTTAQLIPHAQVQHIAQSATVAGTSGTQLVKTVSAPVGGVQIPVSSVNINVSVPQQKGVVGEYQ